jgi:hypothetical protein
MSQQFKLISMNTRMATDEDSHIPAYDHTKLSNINTCPTWGILRYSHHKKMSNTNRSMPLEAGSAAHESFSAVRWYQFHTRHVTNATGKAIEEAHGIRIFGQERYESMRNTLSDGASDRTNAINVALDVLYSSGFYDDPTDRNRTVSNISESLIAWVDDYDLDRYPIWVRDIDDPNSDIGIENPFDVVVDFNYILDGTEYERTYRFTGKLDGLQLDKGNLFIYEEKTGGKLDDNWLSQWMLSHQITGYCIASTTFTGMPCNRAKISGMRLPIGRIPHEGIRKESVPRNQIMFNKWADWFIHSADMERRWVDDIYNAPMYTHSCNRYFSSCSFLPFCAAHDMEDKEQVFNEMVQDEWSPLHD